LFIVEIGYLKFGTLLTVSTATELSLVNTFSLLWRY